ncbi:fimbrial protein [Lelliottia nimipressuralis]|uniref:Type 1 fimbrial protein n=1 Tax=Lelliottia nimipressuralis TaxID=69220 RepID=A0ABD4KHX5_9ENTR|nr:fimbrial protein [Lelliottia nimipressuralis]MBF4180417.1 type 1 fimbrial protein [Lelliottia nimipressuralis]
MKSTYLALTLASCMGLVAHTASAADGTINFTGALTADTCTVDTASQNYTVNMGQVAKTVFTATGTAGPQTAFQLTLSACPASVTGVQFTPTSGAVNTTNTDLLALASGSTATGVGIALYDGNGTQIPYRSASTQVYPVTDGAATINLSAALVSTADNVTSGDFTATTPFYITYQ